MKISKTDKKENEETLIKGRLPDNHKVEYCLEEIAIDEEKLPQIKKEIEDCLTKDMEARWEKN